MTHAEASFNPELLHAFVDGHLDPEQVQEVLVWLRAHPDDAVMVAEWQAQRIALRRLHREMPLDKTPEALTRIVAQRAQGGRRTWWPALAAAMLLGIGVAGGRLWHTTAVSPELAASQQRFAQDALVAHAVYTPEVRHPVEVTAADEAHLVQWLSRRLGAPLKAPSLQARGFKLLGGRLLPGDVQPRAQFMYEDAQGRRLTLYITVFNQDSAPEETAFRSLSEGKLESFYWVEGRFGYALSGELPGADVMAVARDVYTQVSAVR